MKAQDLIAPVIAAAEQNNPQCPDDYVGADGLLYCGKCRTPKQARIELGGKPLVHPTLCACMQEAQKLREQEEAEQKHRQKVEELQAKAFPNSSFARMTFANDDGRDPVTRRLRKWADLWPTVYKDNTGLLLWGGVGNGKTYGAAAIGNAVIEEHEATVRITSFPAILNDLMQISGDRNEYVRRLVNVQLLIIDDLGAERNSAFALEQVYAVVDGRYQAEKPLIVTTNLSLTELQNPSSLELGRIYDRILELCVPIRFSIPSRRKAAAAEKLKKLEKLLLE